MDETQGHTGAAREFGERLFIAWQPTIHRLCFATARRFRLHPEDAKDFASEVHIRLISNNYAVLRRFRGQGQLGAYLKVVIQRQMLDRNNRVWGKWRPSRRSKRLGPAAVRLERLTVRDGVPFEHARVSVDPSPIVGCNLAEASWRWRARKQRVVPVESLRHVAAPSKTPYEQLAEAEGGMVAARAAAALRRLVKQLPAEAQQVLALRFGRGQSTVHLARLLNVDERLLYRRTYQVLRRLRRELEDAGYRRADVLSGIGSVVPLRDPLHDRVANTVP